MAGLAMQEDTVIDVDASEVAWDLRDLYAGVDAPEITHDLDTAAERARAFDARYRGRLAAGQMDGDEIYAAVAELEGISEILTKVLSYAHLLFAADTVSPAHGGLLTACQERLTAINKHLMFFDLEWAGLPETTAVALLADPALTQYRHHLLKARAHAPYRLSEPEELLLDEKANTGNRAFSRLFDEILADARFPVASNGAVQDLREEEVLALLHSPDRATRKAAAAGLTAGLVERRRTLTFIFNTLVLDHGVDCRLRRYPDVMTARHLANETDGAAVEALLSACEAGLSMVARYYRLKRRLLGLDELCDYDRYAPLAETSEKIPWPQARDLVLAAYRAFSPRMATIAEEFFSRRWIDAASRPGKRGGAFCASTVPSVHPYVLLSYQGRPRDVQTLAHELGHGVHQYLARDRGLFAADTPLTTAETASVFGEMLVFQSLKEMVDDPRRRLTLICAKIEDSFATVFRQAIMSRFEQSLHKARREEGELPAERIDELWMATNRPMFGDALRLTDDYRHWWMYIPHFIHSPFYTYAYSFGELLVLALFEKYNSEGDTFVPAYLDLLAAGGSAPPGELLSRMGVDITAGDFWEGGLAVLSRMVAEAESLGEAMT